MNKMTKVITTMGVIGAMVGMGTYMYKKTDKSKYKKYFDYILK